MELLNFLIAVGFTTFVTFIFFRLFGTRSNAIFITASEKKAWDKRITGLLRRLLTVTNVFGTITSLATLLFLAGSAKLFGVFALATGVTFALSAYITNPITKKFLQDPAIQKRYSDGEQVGGVIASLFWTDNEHDKLLSKLVKAISIFSTFSIIWLELSLFSNFSSAYLGIEDIAYKSIVAFATFFVIFYFVIKYGLRGFVFADLFHTPVIIVMGLCIVGFLFIKLMSGSYEMSFDTFWRPILAWDMAIIFAFHVLVLNLFQVLCTEPHWFRLWLFKEVEITSQKKAVIGTGAIWIILLFIGFSSFALSGKVGEEGVASLLDYFGKANPYFILLFWMAAAGALFSTVDTQMYSILLVSSFDAKSGKLPMNSKRFSSELSISVVTAFIYAILYFIVVKFQLPFEKILLFVVPFGVVVLPLFIAKYTDRKPTRTSLIISAIGYIVVGSIGFILPELNFHATLSAVFVPVVVSVLVVLTQKKVPQVAVA